jgi:indole-3-glycerol phosphate synthase
MNTPPVLAEIARYTRTRIAREMEALPRTELEKRAARAREPRPLREAFEQPGLHVIAEIKRASPSEGPIAPDADPVAIAREYLAAGARALSVLTEPGFFRGNVEFLSRIRSEFPEARLLMKDFVLDEYQLLQARAFGADSVLLIVAMLEEEELSRLFNQAHALGFEPLVEVHDEHELEAAHRLGAKLIGVNNRNLKTMAVSLETSSRLVRLAPQGACLVAESGLSARADLDRLSKEGFRAFLIGTTFMKSGNPGKALAGLLGKGAS